MASRPCLDAKLLGKSANSGLAHLDLASQPHPRVPDRGGGSPAVTKKAGKGPPFTRIFRAAYAVGGTLQIVKKGVRGSQNPPSRPPETPFLGETPDLGPWF